MWPRLVEIVIGVWLVASPWVLPPPHDFASTIAAVLGGAEIILLGWLSYLPSLRKVHLVEIIIAVWLLAVAYTSALPPNAPVIASHILTAFVLMNFAIIPTQANRPPRAWEEFRNLQPRSTFS
jgi:hypothetical protein